MRRCLLALCVALVGASAALACPFCIENRGMTLAREFKDADMVVVGTYTKTRPGKKVDFESDLKITEVIKAHPALKGKEIITLPKFVTSANSFLVYMGYAKGEFDAYRNNEIFGKSDLVEYLKGAVKVADAAPAERLRYAFTYLQDDDFDVSLDAYREFARTPYADYKDMARALPADTIAAWLKSPKTAPYRYGLYASLLGHAGAKEPAKYGKVLRDMIDDPDRSKSSGIDGLLAGYAMLQPAEALRFLQEKLTSPKEKLMFRYACLRAVRFFFEQRPDVYPEKDMVHTLELTARDPEMCEFAVEDLRRWNRWEATPAVLDLFERESHDSRLTRRAILRFALHAKAQGVAQAAEFVERQEPALVRETLTSLERETDLKKPWVRGEVKEKAPAKKVR